MNYWYVQLIVKYTHLDLHVREISLFSVGLCLNVFFSQYKTVPHLCFAGEPHAEAALFDHLDRNGDGEVNLQEFQAAKVRVRLEMNISKAGPKSLLGKIDEHRVYH